MRWGYRLRGWFWSSTRIPRQRLRSLAGFLAGLKYRLTRGDRPTRIDFRPHPTSVDAPGVTEPGVVAPRIAVVHDSAHRREASAFVERQTENALVLWHPDQPCPEHTSHLFVLGEQLDGAPSNLLEVLLLVAVTFDVTVTTALADADSFLAALDPASHHLFRLEQKSSLTQPLLRAEVVGFGVPFLGAAPATDDRREVLLPDSANAILAPWAKTKATILRCAIQNVEHRLRGLEPIDDARPTALFLLPYLAIGGAEKLLLHLLDQWQTEFRAVIVTTEPHSPELGSTVDRCLERTPHVYTLGDWLPRSAQVATIRHLLRRYEVEALVSWNGTSLFFDSVSELVEKRAGLRVVSQLFNHEGGWMERYSTGLVERVDTSIAINRVIAREIEERWGGTVDLVEHAVPEARPASEDERRNRRRELGIPQEAFVVGGFFRLHPQKRPADFLAVARRFVVPSAEIRSEVWFVLAGGGPLDGSVDSELERAPIENLVRLPFVSDTEPLFEALDLCMLCSSFEGLPVFLLEGLARAIPFVSTPVGDVASLVEAGAGWSVSAVGDVDGFVERIQQLSESKPMVRDAGRAGRQLVRARFGVEDFAAAYRRAIFGSASHREVDPGGNEKARSHQPGSDQPRNETPRNETPGDDLARGTSR